MNATLETFEPLTLQRWVRPNSYMGAEWTDYYGAGFGQSRDSNTLERCNFETVLSALKRLDETSPFDPQGLTDEDGEEVSSRFVVRESHWAVGWVEWIAIHESDIAALKLCDEFATSAEDYPSLDDEKLSGMEMEAANQTWKNCYNNRERVEYIRAHRRDFEFHDWQDMLGCVRGNYFCGDYSAMAD